MKPEEQIVFEHLKKLYGENVVYEPERNSTPDFVVNSSIAVEVRRLNQYFLKGEKHEELEKLYFALVGVFTETSEKLNYLYAGTSYWVDIYYKRPLSTNLHQAKKDMELALRNFLVSEISRFPYEVSVNSEITFSFYESKPGNGKLFPVLAIADDDAGGGNILVYVENIRHCIAEKSRKISNHLQTYHEWWLYLVDNMELGLDVNERAKVVELVDNIGNFSKVVVLNFDGEYSLLTILKQKV